MQREPAEIEREIELTRVYLSDTVDAIATKVSPKAVAGRTASVVKAKLDGLTTRGTETFTVETSEGEGETYVIHRRLRLDRVAMVAGALATVAALVVVRVVRGR